MMDTRRKGRRCRAKTVIRSHAATIRPLHQGTISHEVESLGRQLILVQWDAGLSIYAFPDEIEIVTYDESRAIF